MMRTEDPRKAYAQQIILLKYYNPSQSKTPHQQSIRIREIIAQTMPQHPVDQYGNPMHHNSGYASAENDQSESGRSPLSMSLGFLKNLTEKKSTRGTFHASV